MNNYIDERLIKQNAAKITADSYIRVKYGRPLGRKTRRDNIFVQSIRFVAAIFLLIISTFGGDEAESSEAVGKFIKNCFIFAGVLLALWGVLVVMSNLINVVTLLPTWSLILGFAVILLGAVGFSRDK